MNSVESEFRGSTLECITIFGCEVGKDKFVSYAKPIIEKMIEIQNNGFTDNDPQKG